MDPSNIANLVVGLSIRYSFQVLAALAILAAGFVCARIVGRAVRSVSGALGAFSRAGYPDRVPGTGDPDAAGKGVSGGETPTTRGFV